MSNSITLVGNLTADPALVTTANGTIISKFSLAVNRLLKSNAMEGKPQSVASFFNCVAFGDQAANAAESLRKGNRVVVTGRIDQRSWTDPQEQRHTTYEVVVDDVAVSLRFGTTTAVTVQRFRPSETEGRATDPSVLAPVHELVGASAARPSGIAEPF